MDNETCTSTADNTAQILVIEDHRDIAFLLKIVLERNGYSVRVALTVQSAECFFAEQPFDLIISDIMLPDGTGWELLPRLRELRPVRAIAISALASSEDVARSLRAGFLRHLTKPVSSAELYLTVSEVLAGSMGRGQIWVGGM
jgi:two-component system CheB/CheR fusion protein